MLSHPYLPFVRTALVPIFAGSLLLGLAGCGSDDKTTTSTVVTGTAIAGAVSGEINVINGIGTGQTTVASATVSKGIFSVSLPNSALTGPLVFIITGTYTDEVSGNTVTLDDSNPLALLVSANHFSAGRPDHVPVTPSSSVIYHLVQNHAMTLAESQTVFQSIFGYLPDTNAVPFDPSLLDSTAANARPLIDQQAAFRAGVFSQLASDLGLTGDDIAALLAGLAEDLTDGEFDGENTTSGPVIIGNGAVNLKALHDDKPLRARLLNAYGGFAGSDANNAGLNAPINGLPSMDYDVPGSSKDITTADGRHLRITLDTDTNAPIAAGFWTSRVKHKISVVDTASGDAINIDSDPYIKTIGQQPFMNMLSGHSHSTPHSMMTDTSNAANGEYVMDSYYLMSSVMGMGASARPMGVWNYSVNMGEDTNDDGEVDQTLKVMFHPQIKMPMKPMIAEGTTLFSKVSNNNHSWTDMTGITQARPFRIWLHNINANANTSHDLSVFISTRDMANMDMSAMDSMAHDTMGFPAVYQGQTLHGPLNAMNMRPAITLNSVTVEVSLDDGTTWQNMAAEGVNSGRYNVASLTGLSTTALNIFSFRLTINDGSNSYVMTTKRNESDNNNAILNFVAPTL